MGSETGTGSGEAGWKNAISRERDRRQSQVLVGVVGTALVLLGAQTMSFGLRLGWHPALWRVVEISVVFALAAWGLRAATPAAAGFGGVICLLVSYWMRQGFHVWRSGLTPLLLLFVLTFGATKLGKRRKAAAGLAEGRRGRQASQIIANLGAAGLGASLLGWTLGLSLVNRHGSPLGVFPVYLAVLAALGEATADTVSSEIGQAFGGRPFLLTTFRRVEPGTDGAVSWLGTLAGVAAAFVVIAVGGRVVRLGWLLEFWAMMGAVAGLWFDSLLGATVERWGWMGNDLVNFGSTVFAVGVGIGLLIWI